MKGWHGRVGRWTDGIARRRKSRLIRALVQYLSCFGVCTESSIFFFLNEHSLMLLGRDCIDDFENKTWYYLENSTFLLLSRSGFAQLMRLFLGAGASMY